MGAQHPQLPCNELVPLFGHVAPNDVDQVPHELQHLLHGHGVSALNRIVGLQHPRLGHDQFRDGRHHVPRAGGDGSREQQILQHREIDRILAEVDAFRVLPVLRNLLLQRWEETGDVVEPQAAPTDVTDRR